MSRIFDKLKGAEQERAEKERAAEEAAQARIVEERRGLELARQRAEAESRATASLQARITAEEALARKAAEREAEPGYRVRLGAGWAIVALLLAASAGAYVYLTGRPVPPPTAPIGADASAGEPLKLKLDYRLR